VSEPLTIATHATGIRFSVRVVVRASRSGISGVVGGALKVRLAAPPVDGEANDELVRVLARTFRVAKSAIHIVAGATSRSKTIDVAGLDAAAAQRALAPPP
jgi:uncharacterized protein (TIGR00251 family)